MFSKVLAALDTDENCESVFEQALDVAKQMGAALELLHVLTPAHDDTLSWAAYYPGIAGYSADINEDIWEGCQQRYEEYKNRGKVTLERWVNRAGSVGVSASFLQIENSAGQGICDRAEEIQADLIVVGSHGRKGLSEIFMGSVSNYVMHHAPCSVLVVHVQGEQVEEKKQVKASVAV